MRRFTELELRALVDALLIAQEVTEDDKDFTSGLNRTLSKALTDEARAYQQLRRAIKAGKVG